MRGTTTGVAVRRRIGDGLPAMFLDDDFVQRLCDGLDEVLAPIPSALDNFSAVLDPSLAAPDFLEWLGGWVGVEIDHTWPIERRRMMVARAADVFSRRGTRSGMEDLIELFTGVRPEIIEGGATSASQTPLGTLPGDAGAPLVVRLAMPQPAPAVLSRLHRLVTANKPAHLSHRVEFVSPPRAARLPPPPGPAA